MGEIIINKWMRYVLFWKEMEKLWHLENNMNKDEHCEMYKSKMPHAV